MTRGQFPAPDSTSDRSHGRYPTCYREQYKPRQAAKMAREQYEMLAKQAAQAYDAYAALVADLTRELAQNDEAVRGSYGKASGVVTEFGTAVLASPGGRKAKPQPTPKPQPQSVK